MTAKGNKKGKGNMKQQMGFWVVLFDAVILVWDAAQALGLLVA